jgi:cytidylate kinase|uniref:(d)CMP kinase n=3 Tax=Candidatus Limnocylindrus sp. TaxID=2802978 RepID=UPI00404998FD
MRIAIDGPASSGKSSVGRLVAEELGFGFLDTGLLYRAITRRAIDLGWFPVPTTAAEVAGVAYDQVRRDLTELASATDAQGSGLSFTIVVDDKPLSDAQLEAADVELYVPAVASIASVRDALRAVQRNVAARGGSVLAGRDIGTVVLPDAECKIFLDATAEKRAIRRATQRGYAVGSAEHQAILASLIARDAEDRARPVAPLIAATDAITIHTDEMALTDVVKLIVAEARRVAR